MSEKDRLDIMDIGLGKLEKEIAELKEDIKEVEAFQTKDLKRIEKLEDSMKRISGTVQDKVWEIVELREEIDGIRHIKFPDGQNYWYNADDFRTLYKYYFNLESVLKDYKRCLLDILNYITEKPEYQEQDAYLLQDWIHDFKMFSGEKEATNMTIEGFDSQQAGAESSDSKPESNKELIAEFLEDWKLCMFYSCDFRIDDEKEAKEIKKKWEARMNE